MKRFIALVMAFCIFGLLTGCHEPNTADPDEIIGYVSYGDNRFPLTLSDLRPEYFEAGGFPNEEVAQQLRDKYFEELKAKHEGTLTVEDEVNYFERSRKSYYEVELLASPSTRIPLFDADLPIEYIQNGYGDFAARYIINLKQEATSLKAPHWLNAGAHELLVYSPNLWELIGPKSTALTVWLSGDGEPRSRLYTRHGSTLQIDNAWFRHNTEGQYHFDACANDDPCMLTVAHDEFGFTVCFQEVCKMSIEATRAWYGIYDDQLPGIEQCFKPLCGEATSTFTVPDNGKWNSYDEVTCVFADNLTFNLHENSDYVEAFNCRRTYADGETEYGCLILREGTAPLWIEGAVLCAVTDELSTLRLWYAAESDVPSYDVKVKLTATGWRIS